jgi:outer membrane protein assembly factor BamA
MRYAWLGLLLFAGPLLAGRQDSEFNVNSRYTVETVVVSSEGWTANFASAQDQNSKLSTSLGREIAALVGEKLNPATLDELARRLRKELNARAVEHNVLRGSKPDHVQVVFEVKIRPSRFDINMPKFLYHAKQGWSGAVEGTVNIKQNGFTFGLVSDGDELAERYAGLVARYENRHLGTDRVHLNFDFESYHQQWNRNTLEALPSASVPPATLASMNTSGVYRTRQNFEPSVTVEIAKPLTLSVGTSFQRMQVQYPAAHTEAANALITTLRFHRTMEDSDNQHDLDAGYSLRAATRVLDSDFAYTRHSAGFRYTLTRGKNVLIDDVSVGLLSGRAPVFERFILGNSSTLRGWHKFDLDPVGGNRMVHNTVEYRYGIFEIFYDTGAIWEHGETPALKHSLGLGLRQGAFFLALAFPVRGGRVDPIFMVGMTY